MLIKRLNNLSDRAILLVLLLIGLATSGASFVFNIANEGLRGEWLEGWFQNFSTEMFGAFLGFWLLGIIVDRRRQSEAKLEALEELKQRLIREVRSKDNNVALNALAELSALGWRNDGSLHSADLRGANLQRAGLRLADLQGADLEDANLQGAKLEGANLCGSYLGNVNLQDAFMRAAQYNEKTVLPDYTLWTPETDMARFTNPNRPDFWRSDNPESPAYRGDD